MQKLKLRLASIACAILSLSAVSLAAGTAAAQEEIKVGLIVPLSGAYSGYGQQMANGAKLYLKQNGDTVKGKKVNLIVRDSTGLAPEVSRRVAQELISRENVDVLAGFAFTPSALAVAPLATQSKTPMVLMNAATTFIPERSPYIIRTSWNLRQGSAPVGTWAAENGIKTAYTLIGDLAPGIEAGEAFEKAFVEGGGKIIGHVRVPFQNVDFSAYTQRIKDAKPDAVFVFLAPGDATVGFTKSFTERGLREEGIKLLSGMDLTQEDYLEAMGDTVVGTISSGFYTPTHDSALNEKFVKGYAEEYGEDIVLTYWALEGYDGMGAIMNGLDRTGGDADGDKLMAAFKGMEWESPRGPIKIDPETRDIVQNIYMREVERVGGKLQNTEFYTFEGVK